MLVTSTQVEYLRLCWSPLQWLAPSYANKYQTKEELIESEKRSSLLKYANHINSLIVHGPWGQYNKESSEKNYVQCVCKLQRFIIENYFSNWTEMG